MAGYIGSKASVVSSGAERKKTFAITTSTISLTGLVYTPNMVHVFHNGIRLVDATDYTATNGTSITLTNSAENGDEVVVVSYASFSPADAYTKAEADAEFVQVSGDTMTGDLTVGGAFTSQGIDDNATSTAVTINGSGHVTKPYQPAFHVRADYGAQTYFVNQAIGYTLEEYDVANNFANSRFTAPVAGLYHFDVSVFVNTLTANTGYSYLYLTKNGSYRAPYVHSDSNGIASYITLTLSRDIQLAANDYVQVYLFNYSTMRLYAGSAYNHFSGYLIG